MHLATTTRKGKRFVLVPETEYRHLVEAAGLTPMPPLDEQGNANALDFARASIARTVARGRRAAGLSQHDLAKRAGLRTETISRIESGKHTATINTLDRIDRALRKATRAAP